MKNIIEYKGYIANIEFSADDNVLFGVIQGIKDLVSFEAENIVDLITEFHEAVDDYLETCKILGKEPE